VELFFLTLHLAYGTPFRTQAFFLVLAAVIALALLPMIAPGVPFASLREGLLWAVCLCSIAIIAVVLRGFPRTLKNEEIALLAFSLPIASIVVAYNLKHRRR
jgi:hypothetical protein